MFKLTDGDIQYLLEACNDLHGGSSTGMDLRPGDKKLISKVKERGPN